MRKVVNPLAIVLLVFMCNNLYAQIPIITSFSPISGQIGDTVIITGTNFSTTGSDNIVWFGAVKTNVIIATSTQLKVTVPIGATYQSVSVTLNGNTAYSNLPFLVTFPTTGVINASAFASKIDFTPGTNPYYIATGDLDGDSKTDLAVTNMSSNTVSVFRNTSASGIIDAGSFSAKVDFTAGTAPVGIAIADLDGDGKKDLVVTNSGSNTISVFLNTSTSGTIDASSFAPKVDFPAATNPYFAAVGDIDLDGKPDIAVVNNGSNSFSVYRNISSTGSININSFEAKVDFPTGSAPFYIAIGDLDSDSKPDLTVTNYSGSSVSVFRNTATSGTITSGSFAPKVDFTAGSSPTVAAIGDIDSDGKPEITVSNLGSNTISVFQNASTAGSINSGSFATRVDFATGSSPTGVTIGDIDGDSKPDLAFANRGSSSVSVLRNTSTSGSITSGSFAAKIDFVSGLTPNGLAVADFDKDGKPDLVVTNFSSHTLSVLRNTIIVPPVITSFTPTSGKIGTTVTITGKNFNTTPANNIVRFGAVSATVNTASKTQLGASVPAGTTFSQITVTDITTGLTAFSREPFKVTFHSLPIISSATLDSKVDFTVGSGPYGVAIGDIDGDSKPDLVSANYSGNNASVLRNTASSGSITTGSFATNVDFSAGSNTMDADLCDIDGDGKLDLTVTNRYGNSVSIFRNISTSGSITSGSFETKVDFSTGTGYPIRSAFGDLDCDGKPDLVVVNYAINTISIFKNISSSGSITSGSFDSRVDFSAGPSPASVSIGDIDGDHKPDLAVANQGSNTVSVFRNISTPGSITAGSFSNAVDFPTGNGPYNLELGDVDGDSKPDLIVLNYSGNTMSILRNISTPGLIESVSFLSKIDFATGTYPLYLDIGDIDGDGKPDIAVSSGGSDFISVYRNTSTAGSIVAGSFTDKVDFATGSIPKDLAIGDIDGDGKPDISVSNYGTNTISVLRNIIAPAPPTITSFYPTYGQPGASVNLYGPNFNTTISNNIVWFGAVKATVTYCTETQLTVTVPAGATYQPISVTDIVTGLTGNSNSPFIVGFPSTKVIDATSFSPKVDFPVNAGPSHSAIGDLDCDGKPDIVVTNSDINSISVFRNISTLGSINAGSFDSKVDLTTGEYPYSVSICDIDGDGKQDIIVANFYGLTISVFRNISTSGSITTGSFEPKVDFEALDPYYVAISDIDGDGKPDIVFSNNNTSTLSILKNKSIPGTINATSFASSVNFSTGTYPYKIAIGDIDNDGKPDISVINQGSNTISVFRNTSVPGIIGSGSLSNKVDIPTISYSEGIAISDIDGDGKQDLINTNTSSGSVSILRNISTPGFINTSSFAARVNFPTGTGPYDISIADLNSDGKADLAVANYGSNTVSLFKNTSTSGSITSGSLAAKVDFATGSHPYHVTIGDIDGDGKPDLAVANYSGNSVSVFQNSMIPPVPATISSFSPIKGPVGTIVNITGTNFNPTALNNIVWFGPVKAIVNTATATQLSATVPVGATCNALSVTDITTGLSAFSNTKFTPIYSSSYSINTSTFGPNIDFGPGSGTDMVIGDIDGDNKPELIGAGGYVYRNLCTPGSISSTSFDTPYLLNSNGYSVAVGDIDGDGKLDLAFANMSGIISIFQNISTTGIINDNSFAPRIDIPAPGNLRYIAMGDIDNDGRLDIGVTSIAGAALIVRNTSIPGSIKFETYVGFITGPGPRGIAFGDIDGDSKTDLITGNTTGNNISVLRNTSSPDVITFASKVDYAAGIGTRVVVIGDFDGDSKQDIAAANYSGNTISVFRNTATSGLIDASSLAPMVEFVTGTSPWDINIGDIDGDGSLDIATANAVSSNFSLLKNTCTPGIIDAGSFASRIDIATPSGTYDIAIADLDGDGKPDISVADAGFSVFQNTIPIPPVIFSLTPASGPVGTSVTITGKNFSTIASENIVWFGAVQASVTAAAETELTVTVPVGATYQPVSVTVNGVTAYSSTPFNITFPSSHIIDASTFAPKIDFASGTNAIYLAISDLDIDGKPDVAVINTVSNTTSLFRNTSSPGSIGAGSFDPKVDLTLLSVGAICASDLDGDGKHDLSVVNNSSNLVSIYRNISTPGLISGGSFESNIDFNTGTAPSGITCGDIDGDGKPDIVVTNETSNTVSVYHNTSSPGSFTTSTFASKVDFNTGTAPRGVALGDIDGDNKIDLIVANYTNSSISVFRNTSIGGSITSGSFSLPVTFTTGTNPRNISITDIDSDGKPDLAVTNFGSGSVSLFKNTSTTGQINSGTFATKIDIPTGTGTWGIAFGDIDGDGKPDMSYTSRGTSIVSVFRNISTPGAITSGSFLPKVDFATGDFPMGVRLVDIDGDSKPDILVANNGGASFSVLRNTIQDVTPPTLGTITQPTCLIATASITLNGLPGTGTWTLTRYPGGITTTGTGSSSTISLVAAGTYTFTVTNSAGVTSSASPEIVINSQPSTPAAPVIGTITQPTCTVATGSVNLSGLPETGSWTLTSTPGGTTTTGTGTSYTLTDLVSGTYTYTVSNASGCVSTASTNVVIIAVPSTPASPVIGTITHPTCSTITGNVVLSGLPAEGTWILMRSPGGTISTGTGVILTISELAAGTYTFTVTDASGCISVPSSDIVINSQPPSLTAPVIGTVTHPTCTSETGSVDLNGLPETDTWTIARNPGGILSTGTGSSITISELAAGTYTFTVSNSLICISLPSADVVINPKPAIPTVPVAGTVTNPTCSLATGSVILSDLPQTGTWTLTRNPGGSTSTGSGTSSTISGLSTGTYTYTVTNESGCISGASSNITIGPQLTVPTAPEVGTVTQPTCSLPTGSVVLNGLPATGSWTLTKTPGGVITTGTGTNSTITGLGSGTYTYMVANSAGCSSTSSAGIVIIKPKPGVIPKIKAKWSGNILVCSNKSDSIISYQWYNGSSAIANATGQYYFTNKQSGDYKVETTDKNSCKNFSNQITVSGSKSLTLFPNPASSDFSIKLDEEAEGTALISVINSSGIKIMEFETEVVKNELLRTVPVNSLEEGIYIIKVFIGGKDLYSAKLIVTK